MKVAVPKGSSQIIGSGKGLHPVSVRIIIISSIVIIIITITIIIVIIIVISSSSSSSSSSTIIPVFSDPAPGKS